jgi:hypothetical protein
MLNKDICKKCTIKNWSKDDDKAGILMWNESEKEKYWEEGYVICPLSEDWGNQGCIKSNKKPCSSKCPYKLEQLLMGN